jgi:hypothetical protein
MGRIIIYETQPNMVNERCFEWVVGFVWYDYMGGNV